ncbi:MAG: hypothetical protein M3539_09310 [Acidobacteriota bacterium]|nr:hypothetical protein [Acidobacteriota bacterium]
MPRGDKGAYTDKQKRQAEHIEGRKEIEQEEFEETIINLKNYACDTKTTGVPEDQEWNSIARQQRRLQQNESQGGFIKRCEQRIGRGSSARGTEIAHARTASEEARP